MKKIDENTIEIIKEDKITYRKQNLESEKQVLLNEIEKIDELLSHF